VGITKIEIRPVSVVFSKSFEAVAMGGPGPNDLATAAATSGFILEYGIMAEGPTPYALHVALRKHSTIKAYTLFEVVSNPDEFPEKFVKSKQYVFEHLERKDLKPLIARTFPLSEIVEAHRYMESNAQIGKIVVTVEPGAARRVSRGADVYRPLLLGQMVRSPAGLKYDVEPPDLRAYP
jgi:hypothetical protein